MKNNYSCKNRKHEKAAAKIRQQWGELGEQFEDMVIPYKNTVEPTICFTSVKKQCLISS